uniref:Uncharacterized protein n=1 Tax=Cacopsylla melanoneura TaxID=428564 RepID=A0A8D8YA04_9HEMI
MNGSFMMNQKDKQRGTPPPPLGLKSLDVNHALVPGLCTPLLLKVIRYPFSVPRVWSWTEDRSAAPEVRSQSISSRRSRETTLLQPHSSTSNVQSPLDAAI